MLPYKHSALVLYGCLTNHYNLCGLVQQKFVLSQFWRPEPQSVVSVGWNQGVVKVWFRKKNKKSLSWSNIIPPHIMI